MDDKRTLIAFLLIGVIILLMPYYSEWLGISSPASKHPSSSQEIPSSSSSGPTPSSGSRTNSSFADVTPPVQQGSTLAASENRSSFAPTDIVVNTPIQKITLSTAGGTITSVQLPKFTKYGNKTLVELVPPGGRGLVLTVTQGDKEIDFSTVEFLPDNDMINLLPGQQATLHMVAQLGEGVSVEKILHFHSDHYGIETEISYSGFNEDSEVFLGWGGGIGRTEKSEETDVSDMHALAFMNEDLTELKLKKDDAEQKWDDKGQLKLTGIRNKYFLTALAPLDEGHSRVFLNGKHAGLEVPNFSYRMGTRMGSSGKWKNLLYLGPLDYEELSSYHKELERAMNLGWPVIRQLSALLMAVFVAAYNYIPNFGWVIILFATAIKALVYPLSQKSFESASKMQQLQPKLIAMKEKFKSDPQRLSRETMKLYKEEGINPLGGCLPMLLQMPIFFSLYNVFSNTIELRQAPFILWIDDLSRPDEVLIAGFGLHVLPLFMAVSMFVQQKMTMKDPKQAALVYLMPIMMIFIFWKLSSGLVLYWTIFNLLSIAQQWLTVKFNTSK